ncbi:MAG: alpha/beta hydrolase [Granulosicoccus sp.]
MTSPESIQLHYKGYQLVGSVYSPSSSKGTVLLNHGFSSNRIGVTRSFVTLARALVESGFSVIAYDRIGQGESPLALADVTLDGEIAQIGAMIQEHAKTAPIHMLGHSLGGMATALAAGQYPEKVASLTLWAPAAFVADEVASGRVLGESIIPIVGGNLVDHAGQGVGAAFVESAKDFDPYDGIESYKGPVNLHHGESDQVVPIRYSEKYAELWGERVKFRRYPDGDHGFSSLPIRKVLIDESVHGIIQASPDC